MLALVVALLQVTGVGTVDGMRVTDVRLDASFRPPGSNGNGLVLSVKIDRLARPANARDFVLIIYDDQGRPAGEIVPFTIRSADGNDRKTDRKTIASPGVYEFVFVIGPTLKQGALLYGENRSDVARRPVGSFKVPF